MKKYLPFIIGVSAGVLLISAKKISKIKSLSKDGVGIAKFLISKGYTKANASGIAGNIFVESSFNPTAVGDNGTSFGLAQWHKSRWDRLNEFCKNNSLNPNTFEAQLTYLDWELKNTEKKAYKKLIEAKTPYDSAYVFAKWFERPSSINPKRMSKAEEIYKKI